MSRKLIDLMKQKIRKDGPSAKLTIALAGGVGERMIERYITGQSSPRPDGAYLLAKACGATDSEAEDIRSSCLPKGLRAKMAG